MSVEVAIYQSGQTTSFLIDSVIYGSVHPYDEEAMKLETIFYLVVTFIVVLSQIVINKKYYIVDIN